jgi:hypothetical protein
MPEVLIWLLGSVLFELLFGALISLIMWYMTMSCESFSFKGRSWLWEVNTMANICFLLGTKGTWLLLILWDFGGSFKIVKWGSRLGI